jgi:hypothetical protein
MPDPAHLLMLAATAARLLSVQLASAEISIELAENTAVVEARYELSEPVDSLRLSLIRFPDQHVEPEPFDVLEPSTRWEAESGLTWVTVSLTSGERIAHTARLRYRVTGTLARIPIPVPEVPAEPGLEAVTLTVRGLPSARLLDGFPRLVRLPDGSAEAGLDNVPGFFRRPPASEAWSVSRGAQWFVVLLVAGGSAAWALRARWRRRTPGGP